MFSYKVLRISRTPQGVRGLKPYREERNETPVASHSARSAWIETYTVLHTIPVILSHSARSAWIETIHYQNIKETFILSHSARSAWIETLKMDMWSPPALCRTPQGVRGLKPKIWQGSDSPSRSHSARSAWIETASKRRGTSPVGVALRKECVD